MSTEPRSIGPYQLIEKIGRGSMGEVFRAHDPASGRRVAIKVMAAALAEQEELVERFRREALSAAELDHPNITRVYDFGEEGRQLFMVMELLEGSDLTDVIRQGTLTALDRRLRVMAEVSSGMAVVHARDLVHRDLKPGNIHIQPDGRAKIMDFGLVRLGDSNMTAAGAVMGSPRYMSPEQLRGEKADARSDVFSLGAVFYEMLSGQPAFPGKNIPQIMMAVLMNEPAPLTSSAPDVPSPVAAIVSRCLRKDPAARYQTAGELHAAVEVAQGVYGSVSPDRASGETEQ